MSQSSGASSAIRDHPARLTAYGPPRYSWRDGAALVLLALLVVLFFWRILTPNLADRSSFPPGDFARQFWAFATFEARELAAGRLPLWNPYTYSGAPFWADIQSAVLYPLSLLVVAFTGAQGPSLFSLEAEAVAHFWLAGVFSYLFVRRLVGRRDAALMGAIVFTFGGYLTGYPSQQLAVLEADVWLPLILFGLDSALVDRLPGGPALRSAPRRSFLVLAGLAWGLVLLAGHAQSATFVFYPLTLYVAFLVWAYRGHEAGFASSAQRGALVWAVVVGIGLGLAAVAWLPGLEYMQLSVRAAGIYDKMAGGFPLYDPIQMLLPGSVSAYSPLYVGVLPLLLALWAALTLRRRETAFWGGLALGAFLLSFGGETFLYSPFYLFVPGFSIFRDQERLAYVVCLCLAVLAGYGLAHIGPHTEQLAVRRREHGQRLRHAVGRLLVGAVGLVLLLFYGLNATGWQESSPFTSLLARSVWLAIVLAFVWGLLYLTDTWRSAPRYTSLLAGGYLLLVVLELFTANWKTNLHPSLPEVQTAAPPAVQAIRTDAAPQEVFRVYNEYRVYENYGVPFEVEDAWGASPLRLARYDEMYRSLRMERLWRLLNVKYVITWRQELYAPSTEIYQEPTDKDVTYVHRLEAPAPRAWIVHQVEEASDSGMLGRLDDAAFDPTQVALVPSGTQLSLGQVRAAADAGTVGILARTPGAVSLQVQNPADGLLVLSEIYYPGWQASVDAQPADIVRTDYVLRGVPVPAGAHRVDMVFRPATFTWGLAISALTLGAVVAAGVAGLLRHYLWQRRVGAQTSPSTTLDGAGHLGGR